MVMKVILILIIGDEATVTDRSISPIVGYKAYTKKFASFLHRILIKSLFRK